jgi:hypothetical protein
LVLKLEEQIRHTLSISFVIFAKIGFLFDDVGHGEADTLVTQNGH